MASMAISISFLRFQSPSLQSPIYYSKHRISITEPKLGAKVGLSWRKAEQNIRLRVGCSSDNDNSVEDEVKREKSILDYGKYVEKLQATISSFTPVLFVVKRQISTNYAIGLCIAVVALVITVRQYLIRKSTVNNPGSVADLVKRGQLRSDRRGMSRPLKYDDPFNNPLVKVSKTNSTVEMCGKVYRLAPVTLTEDEQSSHQKRRSRAYQWKRPTIFLKEGESIPPDVDPDTVRWIPANHPFATTVSDIDEELAQNNVYQKRGVPFRIKAEHEALQKKLEALQNVIRELREKFRIKSGKMRTFGKICRKASRDIIFDEISFRTPEHSFQSLQTQFGTYQQSRDTCTSTEAFAAVLGLGQGKNALARSFA